MMKGGGEVVVMGCGCLTRGLTPPLRLVSVGIPELWLQRGTLGFIPATADMASVWPQQQMCQCVPTVGPHLKLEPVCLQ